jgi:hypothetical protein
MAPHDEVCSICGDVTFPQTDSTPNCHRLPCGHSFHVDCIVQWFAHGHSSCPNCRYEEVGERLVPRDVSCRIASARRRKNTPVEVKRLIKRYDDARKRKTELRCELRQHKQNNRQVYTVGNRLCARVCHYSRRERMLRASIGTMCIPGVPLADRYRIAPVSDEEEDYE